MKRKAIDLFCGCGGIATGLQMAGFEITAGVDVEPKYLSTFAHNFPHSKALKWDLSKVHPREFLKELNIVPGELDLIAGGPPCQGFSKNVPRKNRYLDSQNNQLIKTFLDYCEYIQPNMVLMENVAEMKNGFDKQYTKEIIERLEGAGYSVTEAVLNAADYGIPQRRRRAFFVANKKGIKFTIPTATHSAKENESNLFHKPYVNVWEAIGDLPSLEHGKGSNVVKYTIDPFSDFQKQMRAHSQELKNHVARALKPTQYARLAALKPGQGLKDLPKELQVKSGYSGAYGRLTKDMIAPTITRWVFHPGSGRWGHPKDIRVITIREAARIQGFPDTFEFVGSYTDQAGQLGNAVPPLLIKTIVNSITAQLVAGSSSKNSSKRSKGILSASKGNRKVAACG